MFLILLTGKRFFTKAETNRAESVAERALTSPVPPVEDGHRGGRPWRPRLSDAVSMMPGNDWFHGSGRCSLTAQGETLPHLGEEALGRMWNVTEQGHIKGQRETRGPPSSSRNFTAPASCIWRIWSLNLSFVWSLTRALSATAWSVVVSLQTTMS